jgi:hypothetical protein
MRPTDFETDILKLIFQAVPIPNIADDAATAALTDLYVSLLTGDPGLAGALQTTNEVTYTSYARVAVARSTSGWGVTNGLVNPVGPIIFPTITGADGQLVTHFGVGTLISGAGKLLASGAFSPAIKTVTGTAPRIDSLVTVVRIQPGWAT